MAIRNPIGANTAEAASCLCPNCSGVVAYDANSNQTTCIHCGHVFSPSENVWRLPTSERYIPPSDVTTKATAPDEFVERAAWADMSEKSRYATEYRCPTCGASFAVNETSVSISCPYCGNNLLASEAVATSAEPEYIIPFQIDQNAAMQSIRSR